MTCSFFVKELGRTLGLAGSRLEGDAHQVGRSAVCGYKEVSDLSTEAACQANP
jgi:hypothetical protein